MLKKMTPLVLAALMIAGSASAATVSDYTQQAFDAAQKSGEPILVFVEAPWCPVCAKIRPTLAELYKSPSTDKLKVFDVDFDSRKDVLAKFGVTKQSTLIAFHGTKEEARSTGVSDPAAVKDLVAKANS